MVSLPIEWRWTVRPLTDADETEVIAFLRRDPLLNVYLISRILDEGLPGGHTVGVYTGGELMAVASLASNVAVAIQPEARADTRAAILNLIADRILTRGIPVRAMVSDAMIVDGLWRLLGHRIDPPTVVRLSQPVYALDRSSGHQDVPMRSVRLAVPADLDSLVPACAAMHLEEVGINPLERDAAGYRERIRELIHRRRSYVLFEGKHLVFKTELSADTSEAAQLMGVWTSPSARRRGYARKGLTELCGDLLRRGRRVTLFVNDFNDPAIRLYESLGFQRIGTYRALIW